MTIDQALLASGIEKLDAEVLLSDLMKVPREWLVIHGDDAIPSSLSNEWGDRVQRRLNREPVAYITGKKEFYGREFHVTPDVLIPRPATEGLIDATLRFFDEGKSEVVDTDTDIVAATHAFGDVSDAITVVDVGMGSGCIAITLKLERPNLSVIATDISNEAINVASSNAEELHADVQFQQGNLLDPVSDLTEPFIVVSNPPYIAVQDALPPDVADFEPHAALYSGEDGSDHIRTLFEQAKKHRLCRGICIECKKEQWTALQ